MKQQQQQPILVWNQQSNHRKKSMILVDWIIDFGWSQKRAKKKSKTISHCTCHSGFHS